MMAAVVIERDILTQFFNELEGLNWRENLNWISEFPFEQWHGIDVNAFDKRVEVMDLPFNSLTGILPYCLGDLHGLQYLSLKNNTLSGPIPESFGELTNLTYLNLDGSSITGIIPDCIGTLRNMRKLSLNKNKLTGSIPDSIGQLECLEELMLCENKLSGVIPESIGNLTKLGALWLQDNMLTGTIPETVGYLTNLKVCWLQTNQLRGEMPLELIQLMAKGESVTVDKGSFSLPHNIGHLDPSIKQLSLVGKGFVGPIPASMQELQSVERLTFMRGNEWTEGFEFICYMAALKEVEDAFWAEFDDFPDTFPAIARTDSAVVRSEKLQARFVFVRQQLEDSVSSAMK